jgi:hypothetical protein
VRTVEHAVEVALLEPDPVGRRARTVDGPFASDEWETRDTHRSARRHPFPSVAQDETPPHAEVGRETEMLVEWPALDVVEDPEREALVGQDVGVASETSVNRRGLCGAPQAPATPTVGSSRPRSAPSQDLR